LPAWQRASSSLKPTCGGPRDRSDHADPAELAVMFGLQDRLLAQWPAERGRGEASGGDALAGDAPAGDADG
jgi:hypothetical protein